MTDPYKIIVRVHATTDQFDPVDFVPVFHRLIQSQAIAEHLLIDVADYAHVVNGPGTILIASEANIHMDRSDGRLGLTYVRKRPVTGVDRFEQTLAALVDATKQVAAALTADEAMTGKLSFDLTRWVVKLNDRLLAPNTAETAAEYAPRIGEVFGGKAVAVESAGLAAFAVVMP